MKVCSDDCRIILDKLVRRKCKAKRRAIEKGLDSESFDPLDIFVRDKWRCQCCKVKLNKKHRGLTTPLAPELDHIIPLSKGGAHTRSNVQLLCRSCNLNKSNNYFEGEQLLLVG
uniref:HNH endonuclease n=1 Tax=Ningiella ruwaisensis TaxID=2364274 RepID=UPI00109F850E